MQKAIGTLVAFALATACLTACVTRREFVLAPETNGVVLDAETGLPVDGAVVRFSGVDAVPAVTTGPDGRFALPGQTEKRTILALPVGGVFRDAALLQGSAPGRGDAFATAAFIQGGQPAAAIYQVIVLMFPANAGETPLHDLTRDCLGGDAQAHALQLANFISGIDAARPPWWMSRDAAMALDEHLSTVLPSSGFTACARMSEAYELFREQVKPLDVVSR